MLAAAGVLIAMHWLFSALALRWRGFGPLVKGHPQERAISEKDVREEPVVAVVHVLARIGLEPHLLAREERFGSRRGLPAEALDRPRGMHRLGRIEPDQAHRGELAIRICCVERRPVSG